MSLTQRFFAALVCLLLVRLGLAASLPLSNDEAYHWQWTRYLSLGYYDHPGLFAYLLWPFTQLFGNDHEFIIRIPSLIAGTLTPIGVYYLTKSCAKHLNYSSENTVRCAAQAGLLSLSLPLFTVLGMYHTGDASVLCAWTWSLLFAFRGLVGEKQNWRNWLLLGLCVGLGLQSKYLYFMFVPLFGAYLLLMPQFRHWAFRPQPYFALMIGLIIFSPNLYWNSQHEWATFVFNFSARHHKEFAFKHVAEYLAGTLALGISPGLFIYAIIICSQKARWNEPAAWTFLCTFSLIPILFFFYRSFGESVGLHWPTVTYVAIFSLAPLYWNRQNIVSPPANHSKRFFQSVPFWVFAPALTLLCITLISLCIVGLQPGLLLNIGQQANYSKQINSSKLSDLFGWEELGKWIGETNSDFTKLGPHFICGPQYGFVAQVSFYTPTQPHVYLWEGRRVHGQHFRVFDDLSLLKGQNALYVAKSLSKLKATIPELQKYFDSIAVEPEILQIHTAEGLEVRTFALIKCYNYSGQTPPEWEKIED